MLAALVSFSIVIPSPVAFWKIDESRIREGVLYSVVGPNLMVSGFPEPTQLNRDSALKLKNRGDELTMWWEHRQRWPQMPKKDFTVSCNFSVIQPKETQGLVGCVFEPDEGLTGWKVEIKEGRLIFSLANHGSKGTSGIAVATSKTILQPNEPHRIDATYDGSKIELYVDAKLEGSAPAALGEISYNGRSGICLGNWWEGPRSMGFRGSFSSVAIFDQKLSPQEVDASLAIAKITPLVEQPQNTLSATIEPYFQYPTLNEATVMWETNATSTTKVKLGESVATATEVTGDQGQVHTLTLRNLKPETVYYVQAESTNKTGKYTSSWQSFRTASRPGSPVKFAVVGDTQDHPDVNHKIAAGMLAAQPDFALIVGDLVGCGWIKDQWTNDFFGSMRPLLSYVPLLPVLGNHDRNARLYYDHFFAPAPKYYYTYSSGDLQIWVIDTEHDVQPGSEQFVWLEKSLKASKAKWKIVAHHYPPY